MSLDCEMAQICPWWVGRYPYQQWQGTFYSSHRCLQVSMKCRKKGSLLCLIDPLGNFTDYNTCWHEMIQTWLKRIYNTVTKINIFHKIKTLLSPIIIIIIFFTRSRDWGRRVVIRKYGRRDLEMLLLSWVIDVFL